MFLFIMIVVFSFVLFLFIFGHISNPRMSVRRLTRFRQVQREMERHFWSATELAKKCYDILNLWVNIANYKGTRLRPEKDKNFIKARTMTQQALRRTIFFTKKAIRLGPPSAEILALKEICQLALQACERCEAYKVGKEKTCVLLDTIADLQRISNQNREKYSFVENENRRREDI